MKNLLLILASVIILTSCKTQKVIEKHYRDSVHTENTVTKYRDTTIYVKLPSQIVVVKDTVTIFRDGKPYTSSILTAQTDYAMAFSQIIQGKLNLRIENKEGINIFIKNAIKESINELYTSVKDNKQSEKIVIEYKMRWYQKILFWIGLISFIFVAALIVLKFSLKNSRLWD